MEVLLNRALDMNGSPHLIIGFLLKNEQEDLIFKFHDRMAKVRGCELILNVHDMCKIGAYDAC